MKTNWVLLAVAVLVMASFGLALACGEKPAPPPPPPEATAVPVEPSPVPPEPCVRTTFATQWKGHCAPSPTCKGPDSKGFYVGTACTTAK